MRLALIDIVNRGGLLRIAAGYDGTRLHARTTVVALDKRGLCSITPKLGMGAADPTPAGIKIITDEFRGAKPSLADCDYLGRLLGAPSLR
jgi:hypothetical protein